MGEKTEKIVKTVFGVDNAFVRACERVLDLVVLNLLFLLTCLPIVTIGIAKMSLYQVLFDLKQQKRLAIIPTYLTAFKKHGKPGLRLGILELVIVGFCVLDLLLVSRLDMTGARLIQVLAMAVLILATILFLYAYPIATRFDMGIKDILKNAFVLAGVHFPWTFLMIGVILLLTTLLYTTSLTFLLGLSLLLLAGFSSLGFGQVWIMETIFNHYISR
ncbi:DUF624 domain-containing protein [Streptococcus rifensis]